MTVRYKMRVNVFGELETMPNADGGFVQFPDYQKLVNALRLIRKHGDTNAKEIAEAALLSAQEDL